MKKLVISNNNKSQKNIENLYLNFQSYFDYSEASENKLKYCTSLLMQKTISTYIEECEKFIIILCQI